MLHAKWTRREFVGAACSAAAAAAASRGIGAQAETHASPADAAAAAHGVLARQLDERAKDFHLELLSGAVGRSYTLEASGGAVRVAGTDAVALCRGVYSYLRESCNAMITWSGRHMELPATLPDAPRRTVECPYRHVQYFNPCTFGYTMAFWDWPRWERELDWMALHGITMPLALAGQESIWDEVWRSFGVTDAEIAAFHTGPAQLPWHRMGNIDRFAGPLPAGWHTDQRALQRRILDRARSLGMTPVAPAFSGFVPQGFLRARPEVQAFTMLWLDNEFSALPRDTCTFILHPQQTELYAEIGRRFITAYKAAYGEVSYYLADTFNELKVPVHPATRMQELEQFGRTVYQGIQAGDPNGTWVMQAWLFLQDGGFWDHDSVAALLRGVPDDRMLILDYTSDIVALNGEHYVPSPWKRDDAYFGKPWANGMAPTFGGNNNIKGNLPLIASESARTLGDPKRGNLVGWAICPEGIENNEVVYELMTDAAWGREPIDLQAWIPRYCRARYGDYPPAVEQAWSLLLKSAYSAGIRSTRQAWQREPSLEPAALSVNAGPEFVRATELFLSCAPQLGTQALYRNDLIEFVVQAVGGSVDNHLALATESLRSNEAALGRAHAEEAIALIAGMDALLHLRPDRRLDTWVDAARAKARTPDEAAFYDEDARLLITTWGWASLSDYASRVWSGLARDYYGARWKAWFEAQWSGEDFMLVQWQQSWLTRPYAPSNPQPVADLFTFARTLLARAQAPLQENA